MRAPAGAAARPAATPVRPPRRRNAAAPRAALPDLSQLLRLPGAGPAERPLFRAADAVQMGPFKVAPMGLGTWAWGNKLLWGYNESRDAELQAAFDLAVRSGVNLFDTADSYGDFSCVLVGHSKQKTS
jgi:pyridoxine 4-dehydrogenase